MSEKPEDPHQLSRFLEAQEGIFEQALRELERGRKETHWMWFIFPQLKGLGHSSMAQYYGIQSIAEAEAYLSHSLLRERLLRSAAALLQVVGKSAHEVMSSPDDLKLRSSMTLFAAVAGKESLFQKVLEKFYDGKPDLRTLAALS